MSDKKLKGRDDMKVCDLAHTETLTGDSCDGEDDAHTNHLQSHYARPCTSKAIGWGDLKQRECRMQEHTSFCWMYFCL